MFNLKPNRVVTVNVVNLTTDPNTTTPIEFAVQSLVAYYENPENPAFTNVITARDQIAVINIDTAAFEALIS